MASLLATPNKHEPETNKKVYEFKRLHGTGGFPERSTQPIVSSSRAATCRHWPRESNTSLPRLAETRRCLAQQRYSLIPADPLDAYR